jgi:hypothetical protein
VGDLHGDYGKTRAALQIASLIDVADHWIGGRTTLVQVRAVVWHVVPSRAMARP